VHLIDIRLINFKNYNDVHVQCSPGINCIVGVNGSGKTNLIDAIYYLSLTKSAFNTIDIQNINHEEEFFTIIGKFQAAGKKHEIHCSQKRSKKKKFRFDNNKYERLSDHIGIFPIVLIAPNDNDIIREGNEFRRKFFDSLLSQIDNQYLKDLIAYNHNLRQRNGLLKFFSDNLTIDSDLLEPYNKILYDLGKNIYEKRIHFSEIYLPIFEEKYRYISGNKESASIKYTSQFDDAGIKDLIEQSLDLDLALRRTSVGVHKDTWEFAIEGRGLKKFGSQGQQKTFGIALKIAQFDIVKKEKGFAPVLMLDDIFDKLDDDRIHSLMEMVAKDYFSQIFLTDARPKRTRSILSSLNLRANIITVNDGQILVV